MKKPKPKPLALDSKVKLLQCVPHIDLGGRDEGIVLAVLILLSDAAGQVEATEAQLAEVTSALEVIFA